VAGWTNQQLQLIDYLREENRVLREQSGEKRLRFNDDQRRRLAAKAKELGSKLLREVATIVTPETLLAWHRRLIHPKTLQRLARQGEIPGVQIGKLWCFRRSELNAWMEGLSKRGYPGTQPSPSLTCPTSDPNISAQ
jgi:excisionase family DNA binding protein